MAAVSNTFLLDGMSRGPAGVAVLGDSYTSEITWIVFALSTFLLQRFRWFFHEYYTQIWSLGLFTPLFGRCYSMFSMQTDWIAGPMISGEAPFQVDLIDKYSE